MSWAKSRRILLVWPGFEKLALRAIDLRILQQHARYLGSELGLVTREGEVRRAALGFGIPVFRSTADAQRRPWPTAEYPSRQRRLAGRNGTEKLRAMRDEARPKPDLGSSIYVRIASFALGVLAVLVLASVFVPQATITLRPVSQEQTITLPVKVSAGIGQVGIGGTLPSHLLIASVSGTQSTQVSSTAAVPQDKATGVVDFKNLTNAAQIIRAGTIVYSISPTSMRFATQNDASLPATVGALVGVPIEAAQAGTVGNLPANSIQAVEGQIGASISVTNPEPTTGGTDKTVAAPNADDRSRLHAQLLSLLQAQALDKMKGMMGPQDVLLPTTLKAGQGESATYSPPAGEPGRQLTLKLSLEFQAQYLKAADLKQVAAGALQASAPPGFVPETNTLSFSLLPAGSSEQVAAGQFDLQAKSTLVQVLDLHRAAALVRGSSPTLAAAKLRSEFPLTSPPEIRLSPPWWPWLPLIPFRITVTAG